MNNLLGVWKCECCHQSNPDDFERCSYCDLPREHSTEELQKYKQSLSNIKNKQENIWASLLKTILVFIFRDHMDSAWILVIVLLALLPVVKDNMLLVMPIVMVLVIFVGGYLYTKK